MAGPSEPFSKSVRSRRVPSRTTLSGEASPWMGLCGDRPAAASASDVEESPAAARAVARPAAIPGVDRMISTPAAIHDRGCHCATAGKGRWSWRSRSVRPNQEGSTSAAATGSRSGQNVAAPNSPTMLGYEARIGSDNREFSRSGPAREFELGECARLATSAVVTNEDPVRHGPKQRPAPVTSRYSKSSTAQPTASIAGARPTGNVGAIARQRRLG